MLFESSVFERCHYVSLWTVHSLPPKMPSQKVLLSNLPEHLMFECLGVVYSTSPFEAEAHHACFSCCAIAVTSDSPVVVAMLQAGGQSQQTLVKRADKPGTMTSHYI